MEDLFKQFGGSDAIQNLLGGGIAGMGDSQENDEEELDEFELMENIKVTYECFIQNTLSSTSHSVQWLPCKREDPENPQFNIQSFLLGTHYNEDHGDMFGNDSIYIAEMRVPKIQKNQKSVIDYTKLSNDHSKLKIVKEFNHQGEVNKTRAMKQDWHVIASLGNTGDIYIYHHDRTSENKVQTDFTVLSGLEDEGFGMSWNPNQRGVLAAATGTTICIWNVEEQKEGNQLLKIQQAHEDTINDIKFSNINPHLFGTAADDGHYKLWDMRTPNQFTHCYKASEDDLFVISFNQHNDFLFATGGEKTGALHVWDLRMPKYFINDLNFHKDQVNQIEWSPHSEDLFISSSSDGKVFLWDHSKTGEEQARHDYEDGPPELLFPHEMHQKDNIEDICWSPHQDEEHFIVSCSTNYQMQVWKMSPDFLFNEMDYYDQIESIQDMEVE
eukprot:403356762